MSLASPLCALALALLPGAVQEPEQQPAAPAAQAPELTRTERSFATLLALQRSREAKEEALRVARESFAKAQDDDQRMRALEEIRALDQELERILLDYESVATGIDVEAFELGTTEDFDLRGELQKLVRPIVEELKDATEAPRQIERLRGQVDYFTERERTALDALKSVDALLAEIDADDPRAMRSGLEETRQAWVTRVEDIRAQKAVAHFQLDQRLEQRTSIIDSTQSTLANFFRTRGLNLLLAIGTFVVVLFGMRGLSKLIGRLLTRRHGGEEHFYARLIRVLYYLLASLLAIVGSLLVLYATSDWVLLGLALMFLVGVAWASKTALPVFLEQIRLLLNFGTVRERERIVLDGIPYRVARLSFYTLVSNAELAGGVRRLPIRDLIALRSRTLLEGRDLVPVQARRLGPSLRRTRGKR